MSSITRRPLAIGHRAGALALAVALLASGCGSESGGSASDGPTQTASSTPAPEPETEPTADPTSEAPPGHRLDAKGVSFLVPKGWADVTEPAPGLVLAAADLSGSDELADMVIVETLDSAGSDPQALGRAVTRSLAAQEHEKVERLAAVEIAGVSAAHAKAVKLSPGEQLAVDRFVVAAAGETWSITYSTNRWKPRGERARTLEGILASWKWGRA